MDKYFKLTISLITLVGLFLVILIAGNPSLFSLLLVYVAMLGISIIAYSSREFRGNLIYFQGGKSFWYSIILAFFIGGIFYVITKLIPGFSLGLPLLPQTISETLRKGIILFFAPFVESVFFQSVVYGVLRNFGKYFAFIGQAVLFSLAHISAYIVGFYSYPTFSLGLSSLSANLGAFISAFTFAIVGMFFLLRKNINNLTFIIVFHAILNTIILTSLTVIFI